MFITLIERKVVRVDDPTSRRNRQISYQAQKIINSYSSDVIPRISETICVDDGKVYDVLAVHHYRRMRGGIARDEVFLEVAPHINTHVFTSGSYSFTEEWPLITELENIEIEEAK